MSILNWMKDKDKILKISYRMSSGIPFRWEYEIKDESVVEFDRKETVGEKGNDKICGGPITINYYFKGLKEGKTKIIFKYVNFADNYTDSVEEYNVIVDKDNSIRLFK